MRLRRIGVPRLVSLPMSGMARSLLLSLRALSRSMDTGTGRQGTCSRGGRRPNSISPSTITTPPRSCTRYVNKMTTLTDEDLLSHAETLKGNVVLITGAANGVGRVRYLHFLRHLRGLTIIPMEIDCNVDA
jgi:hypothetical protein